MIVFGSLPAWLVVLSSFRLCIRAMKNYFGRLKWGCNWPLRSSNFFTYRPNVAQVRTATYTLADAYINKDIYTYKHTYIYIYIYIYTYIYIHTYIHTYIQLYIISDIHTYIHTYCWKYRNSKKNRQCSRHNSTCYNCYRR